MRVHFRAEGDKSLIPFHRARTIIYCGGRLLTQILDQTKHDSSDVQVAFDPERSFHL